MNQTANTILDMDALMDMSMDGVEAAPDYINPPAGNYVLSVMDAEVQKKESKQQGKGPYGRIQLTYRVDSTVQTSDMPVADGSMFTDKFMVTEDGLTYFKRQCLSILNVTDVSGITLRDLCTALKGVQFNAKITVRSSTGADGKTYENISVRAFHDTPAS